MIAMIAAWENFEKVRIQEGSGVHQVIPNFLNINVFALPHLPFVKISPHKITVWSHRPKEVERLAREQQHPTEGTAA